MRFVHFVEQFHQRRDNGIELEGLKVTRERASASGGTLRRRSLNVFGGGTPAPRGALNFEEGSGHP